jgi:hypothetical protein
MKQHPCLVCGVAVGIALLHLTAVAQADEPNSIGSAGRALPPGTVGQNSKEQLLKDCRREWRADREAMMKRDMTEETYVEQCSVRDDVPAIPSEPRTAPAAAPQ